MSKEEKFTEVVKELFIENMKDACDLAECVFVSAEERSSFIQNAWQEYGDDIEAFVDGEGSIDEFLELSPWVQSEVVIGAIKANFESIFDKPYDEGLNTEN